MWKGRYFQCLQVLISEVLLIWNTPYIQLLYGWVCFRHAIGQFAVRNLLYGPNFLKKMLISEV